MASQADEVFGEVGSDITDEEKAAMKRGGERIGKAVGRGIASRYETAITLFMLDYLIASLSEWAKTITYEEVLADQARVASGQKSALFVRGNQPQAVQPSDSSGGMVQGGDPVAAVKHGVDTNPESAPYLLTMLNTARGAIQNGASEQDVQDRLDMAMRIIAGQELKYQLVQGPAGTDLMLRGIVEADVAKTTAIQERDAAVAERDNLQQQLSTRTQPLPTTDQVAKSVVASDVTALIGVVRGSGSRIRPDAIKPSINAIADKVGVTDKLA